MDGTASDNTATSGLVVYEPGGGTYCNNGASAPSCLMLYRHELGHIFGIFTNTPEGIMGGGLELSSRELRMLATLYSLPHGARVESDGTWKVYGPSQACSPLLIRGWRASEGGIGRRPL